MDQTSAFTGPPAAIYTNGAGYGSPARPTAAATVGASDHSSGPAKAEGSDVKEAIFGSFDGMTSTLGVVAGLLATKASASHVLAAAIGIAVAATVGMGAGQYLFRRSEERP